MRRSYALLAVLALVVGVIAIGGPAAAHTEEAPFVTDLIAGGGSEAGAVDVGEVRVWNDADYLYVMYVIDGDLTPGDHSDDGIPTLITETHLAVAETPEGLPQTKKGNPIPGQFEYSMSHDPGVTEQLYTIDLGAWGTDTDLYIAAHAVVAKASGLGAFELMLPELVTMQLSFPGTGFGAPSYFDVAITGGTSLDGTYDNYCIDTDLTISAGYPYTALVYSSYETLPAGLVEFPENLDLVNWIVNQGFEGTPSPGCEGVYTYGDVQRAIWSLLDDGQSTAGLGPWSQCRVDEILAGAAANGEGYVPGCGEQIAILLVPTDGWTVPTVQITIALVPIPCFDLDETAWGEGSDFPGRNWGMYFGYTVQ